MKTVAYALAGVAVSACLAVACSVLCIVFAILGAMVFYALWAGA